MSATLSYSLSLSLISLVGCLFFSGFIRFRASRTLYETIVDQEIKFEQIKGFSLEGYSITISCQRKLYRRKYAKWYLPDKQYFIYYFYGETTENAPSSLKSVLKDCVSVPTAAHNPLLNTIVENEALLAYLDVIASRLRVFKK